MAMRAAQLAELTPERRRTLYLAKAVRRIRDTATGDANEKERAAGSPRLEFGLGVARGGGGPRQRSDGGIAGGGRAVRVSAEVRMRAAEMLGE